MVFIFQKAINLNIYKITIRKQLPVTFYSLELKPKSLWKLLLGVFPTAHIIYTRFIPSSSKAYLVNSTPKCNYIRKATKKSIKWCIKVYFFFLVFGLFCIVFSSPLPLRIYQIPLLLGCTVYTVCLLRNLEEMKLVKRTIYPEVSPRVEYRLTELGISLLIPMHSMIDWALEHKEECFGATVK